MSDKAREYRDRRAAACIGALAWALAVAPACAQPLRQDPAAIATDDSAYAWGRGLNLADGQLRLGGYLAADVIRARQGATQARWSHASMFAWWQPHEAVVVFGELDYENIAVRERAAAVSVAPGQMHALARWAQDYEDDPGAGSPTAAAPRHLSLERLQLSWTLDDALVLRGGKFLTPVGRWNLAHADPLVWTVSRPLLTQSVYPHNVTGAMASGLLALGQGGLEYALYASNGDEWRPDPQQDTYASVRGARLVWKPASGGVLPGRWELGLSAAHYRQEGSRDDARELRGLDLHLALRGYELSAEWLRTRSRWPAPPPRLARDDRPGMHDQVLGVPTEGLYLQGVAPLVRAADAATGLWAVARLEWIRDALTEGTLRQSTLGLAWRPLPPVSLKIEHRWVRWRDTGGPEGWSASASVLF